MPRRPPTPRAALALSSFLVLVAGASRAVAEDGSQKAQLAQALFDDAKKLMAENRPAEACPKLAESQRLDPSGGTVLHLGICHAAEGKTASAYAELNEALSAARRDGRSDRETVAKAHLAALTPKLVRLVVAVSPEARVPGLEVSWNGTSLPEAQWGVAFPVDPGEHVVAAMAPKRKKWSSRVDVRTQGAQTSVTVPLLPNDTDAPPAASPREPAPATHADAAPKSGRASSQRALGVALAAVGAIGLGVGGAFQLRALGLASERDDAARAGDGAVVATKHDEARSSEVAAVVSASLGGAALAAGAVLFFTAPKRSPTSGARTTQPAAGGAARGPSRAAGSVTFAPFAASAGGGLVFGGKF